MDFGLKLYRPAQKPRLNEAIKKKRLEFAKKKDLDWGTEMWKNALFSYESLLKQFFAQKYRVWRPPGARFVLCSAITVLLACRIRRIETLK